MMADLVERGQAAAIFRNEWLGFFQHPRALMTVPILLAGIFMVAWLNRIAPFAAAVALALIPGLEMQFNNILFRWEAELDALGIYPVHWKPVVVAKNVAAIALTLVFAVPVTIILAYFSPSRVGAEELQTLALYLGSILFPLVTIGNTQSIKNPRRESGWRYEDLMELLWMVVTLAIVSVPAMLLLDTEYGGPILALYAVITGLVWWFRSVPRTAKILGERFTEIIEET